MKQVTVKIRRPVVDRLSFVMRIPDYSQDKTAKNLSALVQKEIQTGAAVKRFGSGRYQQNVRLPLSHSEHCVIQAQPRSNHANASFLRVEYNPAKVGTAGDQQVRQYLQAILPKKLFRKIEQYVLITCLDLAIDIDHVHVRDLLVYAARIGTSGIWFGVDGQPQTIYIGNGKGGIQFRIYDKRAQLQDTGGQAIDHERLRIEVRFRSTYLRRQKNPADIDSLMCKAFSSVNIIAVPPYPQDSTQYVWGLFLDSARLRGLQAALKRLPQRLRKQYQQRLIKTAAVGWWTPDILHRRCTASVTQLGLFPVSVLGNSSAATGKNGAHTTDELNLPLEPSRIRFTETTGKSRRA